MNDLDTVVTLLGGIVLVLALGSARLATSPFPPSLLALAIGVVLGPELLGLVDLARLDDPATLLERIARLTLGIGLVGVALRIPRSFPRDRWREMLVLIGVGMPLTWAISTALVYFVLGLPLEIAALIGAIVTPTDPVAASPIVTGRLAEENIPERLRNAISFESGANDGLGYLFVFLPMLLVLHPTSEALAQWFTRTLLWEAGVATASGLLLGYGAGRLLQWAERRNLIEPDWRLIYTVALALLAVGAGKLIRSDELLVVFAAGAAFTQVVSAEDRKNEERGQEAVNRFFVVAMFVVLGTALPWDGWAALGWSGVALVALVLLLRRLPVVLLLRPWLPDVRRVGDALFAGWFGPIAVAAVYYASLAQHRTGRSVIWDVVSLVIVGSTLAHGASAAWLTRLYGRKAGLRRDAG